jgi:protein-S-isoprenylcysteine O-methyltransferase Ste14
MKQRIKIDGTIMFSAIILTAILCFSPYLYPKDIFIDDLCDFFGLLFILKGTYLRMAARGYKKEFSKKGQDLVMSGPYSLTRNPMYLGTFFIGAGFVLIVWPWWFLAIFAFIFFTRFNVQMEKEETYLKKIFGEKYENYCRQVPRFFPSLKASLNIKMSKVFPWNICWSTKERLGLLGWPLLAVILEIFQEWVVYGAIDIIRVVYVFSITIAFFAVALMIRYKFSK